MSFVINLKFTGLAYAVVCCGVAVVAAAAWRGRLAVLRLGASLALVGLFSVAALGYAPYIRNLQEHGSMFYPLRGPDAYNIMTQDRPANLTHHNRVSRFVIATFSRTGNNMSPLSTELKYPWSVRLSELRALESLTGGGFGPLYAAALVAALAVLGVVAWLTRRSRTHLAIWVIAAATLASLFVHEEAWWARYVPQAWFLPWLVALGSLLTRPRWVRGAGVALLVLISADLALIGVGLARAQRAYLAGTEQYLREMHAAPKPVHVYLHAFPAFRRRLVEADIPYVEIAPPAYTSTRAELIARNYLPPEPVLPPGVERRPVYPHNKVFWYSPH
jgi:hypothetical protein